MLLVTTVQELRAELAARRLRGQRVALVPTMGALHQGHISLIDIARQHADVVVVSIFVNPSQFGPNEDFSHYPRTLDADRAMLEEARADILYVPAVEDVYPQGFSTSIHVQGLSEGLCGAFRPGHFNGVATVVIKLLLRVLPDVAIFGEKDYQQLAVIRRAVMDIDVPVMVIGAPTVRGADGLAMSSRNRYLTPEQRAVAARLFTTMNEAVLLMREGQEPVKVLDEARQSLLVHCFTKIDYLELCDAVSLMPLTEYSANARLLAAAWIGTTRLIDNIAVGV